MSTRMPPQAAGSKNHAGRVARLRRCGPTPSVCTTRPMRPAATSSDAFCTAGTSKRSEKLIEWMRPVRATASRRRSRSASVVQPGLSLMTSLPASIARSAIAARSLGNGPP